MKKQTRKQTNPPQRQSKPGVESKMRPRPQSKMREYHAAGRLQGQVALVTGGDSGIGRAVAFAKEGADVAIVYLDEHDDARESSAMIEKLERQCLTIAADLSDVKACRKAVAQVVRKYARLDVLVNNAATHVKQDRFEDIAPEQLEETFRTNVFSMFYVTQHALGTLQRGARIINTASVTAYRGSAHLIDYSATKGAFVHVHAFARARSGRTSHARQCGGARTRLDATHRPNFLARRGRPFRRRRTARPARRTGRIAPCFVFLASDDAAYFYGQVLHPNGGEIINT